MLVASTADALGPALLELCQYRRELSDGGVALAGAPDDAQPLVLRVCCGAQVAGVGELLDELPDPLLGHADPLRQLRHGDSLRWHMTDDAVVRGPQLRAGLHQEVLAALGHELAEREQHVTVTRDHKATLQPIRSSSSFLVVGTRDELGAADVSDRELATMVASHLGQDSVELLESRVDAVDYDLPAITTGGRWWVSGHAEAECGRVPFRFFVKQVQSWDRHPFFAFVPEEFRELAVAGVPWKTEAEVYRSDFAHRLPQGLSAPRALGVFDVDASSSAIWMEEVPSRLANWNCQRYERAAHLLGRLAASRELAPLAELRDVEWSITTYANGRLAIQVVPLLTGEEVWQHPLCAAFDDELRGRLRVAAARAGELAAEADALPTLLSHGDACPNNLLPGEHADEFVMIDFGFWGRAPVGFDLSQLLVGEVQVGRRGAHGLAGLDEAIVAAYVEGLRAEGCVVPEEQVRRAHALCLLLMTGLSTVPFDLFDAPVIPEIQRTAADRAAVARYALDLVDATAL